jgi:hypothetical protein
MWTRLILVLVAVETGGRPTPRASLQWGMGPHPSRRLQLTPTQVTSERKLLSARPGTGHPALPILEVVVRSLMANLHGTNRMSSKSVAPCARH